jgi:hypothetical protein
VLKIDNPFIGLSVVWAFIGIIIRRPEDYRIIVIAAGIGILIVSVPTILVFLGKKLN